MNRRQFIKRSALAGLMATSPMRALAFLQEFGFPPGLGKPDTVLSGVNMPSGNYFERLGWYLTKEGARIFDLKTGEEILESFENAYIDTVNVGRVFQSGPNIYLTTSVCVGDVDKELNRRVKHLGHWLPALAREGESR